MDSKSTAETGLGESSRNNDLLNTGRNSTVMNWLSGQAEETVWQAEWRTGDDSDKTGRMFGSAVKELVRVQKHKRIFR